MKKLLALLLSVAMLLSLVACGDSSSKSKSKDAEESEAAEEKEEKEEKAKIVFEETVVVDNDDCLIKITEIDPDDPFGYTLKVAIENKSDDITYNITAEDCAVNGVEVETYFWSELDPGKKANESLSILDDSFGASGIDLGEYSDIELNFVVRDYNDYSADPIAYENIHIYPLGEDEAAEFEREEQDTDEVIADTDDVKVTVVSYSDECEYNAYEVLLYIENGKDEKIVIRTEDEYVNGYQTEPYFVTSVAAGKSKFATIGWSEDEFEESDITEVDEIEFTIECDYMDTYDSVFDEEVILNP